MKDLIRKIIQKSGWDIIRVDERKQFLTYDLLYSKYKDAAIEISNLYREFILPEYPDDKEKRTELLLQLSGTQLGEAIYIIDYLRRSLKLDGDVCEFGIAQGATSALLANEIETTKKNLWLFDSFKGLPKPTAKDLLKDDIFNFGTMEAYEGAMAFETELVKTKLSKINFDFNRVRIVPGFIEETINLPNLPSKVCFAYIDFDLYEPILISLNYLHKSLSVNGYIIVDDYDFFSTGAKTAVDEFLSDKKTVILFHCQ